MKPPESPFSTEDTIPPAGGGRRYGAVTRSTVVTDMGGASARGMRRRRNEDAWGYANSRVFVVADGMGGRSHGDVAAEAAVDALLGELSETVVDWRVPISRASTAVHSATAARKSDVGGAVAVAVRTAHDRTSVVHVGDARAYRLRNGLAEPLTRDHSVGETMAELGVHRSSTGLRPAELASLTSFLGDDRSWEEFTVRELTVKAGDRLVLCTDGCYSALDTAAWEAAAVISSAGDAAESMIRSAVRSRTADDATALVIDFDVVDSRPNVSQGKT